jgi:hypothetical protein
MMLTRCFRDLHRSQAVLWRLRGLLLFSSTLGDCGASAWNELIEDIDAQTQMMRNGRHDYRNQRDWRYVNGVESTSDACDKVPLRCATQDKPGLELI